MYICIVKQLTSGRGTSVYSALAEAKRNNLNRPCDFSNRQAATCLRPPRSLLKFQGLFLSKIMVEKPSYYAILPANVRYSKAVCDGAKLLYGEITCLCNKEGYCWASNAYFSELYSKSSDTISRWISELARAGFIFPIVDNSAGNSRKIWLKEVVPIGKNADTLSAKIRRGYRQKSVEGIGKNAEHNNKENNKKEEGGVTPKKTPSPPKDFDEMLQRVNAEVATIEAEKEKISPVPAAPSFSGYDISDEADELKNGVVRRDGPNYEPTDFDFYSKVPLSDMLEDAPVMLVQSFDGQTLPGALVTTVEGLNLEQTTRETAATASILKATGREIQCETADDANDLITAWAARNMATIENWYNRSKRVISAVDLQNIITKFCGTYANHSDSGKRLRFLADPVLFFRNQCSGWLIDQNKYDREQAAKTPTVKRSGAPNSFGGDQSKFKEVQKF